MAAGKEIRTKISSIQSTQKITSAMEMVAASKMRKAQDRMALGKPYARRMRSVVGHIANAAPEYKHMYMEEREIKRVGYIVVTTDRGLCGGLNVNTFRKLLRELKEWRDKDIEVDLCLIGAKGVQFLRNLDVNVVAAATHLGEDPKVADLVGSISLMLESFTDGNIDRLFGSAWSFVWSGSARYRTGDGYRTHSEFETVQPLVYSAMLQHPLAGDGFVRMGRFLPYELPGIGYIDGGQIELENSEPHGARVTLLLPLAIDHG